jgi:hypothetical protein
MRTVYKAELNLDKRVKHTEKFEEKVWVLNTSDWTISSACYVKTFFGLKLRYMTYDGKVEVIKRDLNDKSMIYNTDESKHQ